MVKDLLCLLLQVSGLPLLIREVIQRNRVTILTYHRVDAVTLDRHLSALRRWYTPISLQTYLDARRNGRRWRLPPKAVIVTIDDGHKSVYRLKPVLTRHQIPVTVFLCSGFVGTHRRFWFSAPGLDSEQCQRLKALSDEARIAALRAIGFDDSMEFEARDSLNVIEVQALKHLIDFQSHSMTHPILPACSDEKATEEIECSKRQLEKLDLRVNALAYPNGSYTARELRIARQSGYECGLTTKAGFNSRTTPAYELKRMTMRDDCGVHEFVVRCCGLWALFRSVTLFWRDARSEGDGRRS
jgi:peptidoglycan/xylan/chitin deacetylase (PgdA/CDA1 family)